MRNRAPFPWVTDAAIPLVLAGAGVMGFHWPLYAGPFLIGLGAAIFVAKFVVWLRSDTGKGRYRPIGLQAAVRYLAHRSEWAAKRDPKNDGEWVSDLDAILTDALARGDLVARGLKKERFENRDNSRSEIPKEFWVRGNFDVFRIHDQGDDRAWQWQADGGTMYTGILVDRGQLEQLWPRRSWWAAVRNRSPAERTGIAPVWYKGKPPSDKLRDQDLVHRLERRLDERG